MNILLIAPTEGEMEGIKTLLRNLPAKAGAADARPALQVQTIVTGVGMVNTALRIAARFTRARPDFAIHFGIAGSFSTDFPIGTSVQIFQDCYPEMGAESPEGFLGMKKLGFPVSYFHGAPLYNEFINPEITRWEKARVPLVRGITVNTVHGTAEGIAAVKARWKPDVESMETAAFLQACMESEVPCIAFRGISNYVEPRNREAWDIPAALNSVHQTVIDFLQFKANETHARLQYLPE